MEKIQFIERKYYSDLAFDQMERVEKTHPHIKEEDLEYTIWVDVPELDLLINEDDFRSIQDHFWQEEYTDGPFRVLLRLHEGGEHLYIKYFEIITESLDISIGYEDAEYMECIREYFGSGNFDDFLEILLLENGVIECQSNWLLFNKDGYFQDNIPFSLFINMEMEEWKVKIKGDRELKRIAKDLGVKQELERFFEYILD